MASKPRVLITGAAGKVGTTLWRAWEREDKYDLTLVDLNPIDGARSRVEQGDVRDHHRMRQLCAGQDVLVHLAFIRSGEFGDDPDEVTDIEVSMGLFESARREGLGRIVYASTNHVSGWNERQSPTRFSTPDQIRPDGWYGAMKGMAEVAGRYLSDAFGMRFIAFRIGTFHGTSEPSKMRLCSTLLTPRDCVQLFGLAVDYEGPVKFLVTYATSGNCTEHQVGFLDISAAMDVLGYRPQDNAMAEHLHKFL